MDEEEIDWSGLSDRCRYCEVELTDKNSAEDRDYLCTTCEKLS